VKTKITNSKHSANGKLTQMRQEQNRIVLTKELIEDFYNYNYNYTLDASYTKDSSMWSMRLSDILSASDHWWEKRHCFIQILFPNTMPSKMNPDAPIIEDFSVFDGVYKYSVSVAVNRFLKFLGIGILTDTDTYFVQIKEWFRPDNHNILRVTRLLIFLKGVGMIAELNAIRDFLRLFHKHNLKPEIRDSLAYTMSVWENV